MEKLAIIGASAFQDPLIKKAKDMGYETHVFAWAANDVGERSADVFHPISITEKEDIWAVCRQVGVSACCSIGSDLAVHTVNFIQRKLGMPCDPEITDTVATDKYEMRKALAAAGVACPRFLKVDDVPDETELAGFNWPLIVKPTDRSGSRGIFRVENYGQLAGAVPPALEQSFRHEAVIEEYIPGPEYSCEAVSFEGVHHILAFTKKFTTGSPHFIETGHVEPSDIPHREEGAIREQIKAALTALHKKNGASHAEFKLMPDGRIRIIEIGARMGGDCIGSDLVYLSTGVDYMAAVIDTAFGRAPDLTVKRTPRRAEIRFIFTEDDVRAMERAENVWRAAYDGHAGDTVTDSSNRHGYWITTGPL